MDTSKALMVFATSSNLLYIDEAIQCLLRGIIQRQLHEPQFSDTRGTFARTNFEEVRFLEQERSSVGC